MRREELVPLPALFHRPRADARPAGHDGRQLGISTTLAARSAAVLLIIGGAVDLVSAPQPSVHGLNPGLIVVIGLSVALVGIGVWLLPWHRWSRRATFWLVPVALLCIAVSNVAGGQDPWEWSLFFLIVFAWIGMCQPQGRSLWALPFFAIAYVAPLYPTHQASSLPLISVVYVGLACVILAESVAWLSARWRHAESELSTLMSNLPGMAYQCADDEDWTERFVSEGCQALTGYAPQALIGNAGVAYADLVYADDAEPLRQQIRAAIDGDVPWTCTYRIVTATGAVKWVWERGVAVKRSDGAVRVLEGFIQDVTEQHEAEEKLTLAASEWRQTFDAMHDSVCVLDAAGIVVRCNRASAEYAGMSCAGMVGTHCFEAFHAAQEFVAECPYERARSTGRPESTVLRQDDRWLRETVQPVFDAEGRFAGGIHVVSDITEMKQAEERLIASLARQQAMSEEVIAAIAGIVELRDPYTAGHQRRVSELASAIAVELGLGEDAVAGIRVSGMVHDVGKVIVPAEILSKPGRLSENEFMLIKGHAAAGYEILRAIEFPWPVAEVARQHHERLDGSGYPDGLKGDDILLEARIVAVADVVEAMASHRPYRAALGCEAALEEIRSGSGRRYDSAVVAACVCVLTVGTFSLDDEPRPAVSADAVEATGSAAGGRRPLTTP